MNFVIYQAQWPVDQKVTIHPQCQFQPTASVFSVFEATTAQIQLLQTLRKVNTICVYYTHFCNYKYTVTRVVFKYETWMRILTLHLPVTSFITSLSLAYHVSLSLSQKSTLTVILDGNVCWLGQRKHLIWFAVLGNNTIHTLDQILTWCLFWIIFMNPEERRWAKERLLKSEHWCFLLSSCSFSLN